MMTIRQTLLPALALLVSSSAFGQWVQQTLPPIDATIFPPVARGKNVMWLATGIYGTDTSRVRKAEFIRTADGGKTYSKGTLFNDANSYAYDLLPAPDGKTAYVVAERYSDGANFLQKTTDGGLTFKNLAFTPSTFPDVLYFFDDKNGLYAGDPDSLGFDFEYTKDGGATFTRVDPKTLPAIRPQEVGLQALYSVQGNVMFFEAYDNDSGENRFWRTTDRGLHWTAGSWVATGDNFNARADFADSLHGMILRGIGTTRVQPLYTSDGGVTWQERSTPLPGEAAYPIAVVPGTQTFIAFFGDKTRNKLFSAETNDYGKTWNTYKDIGAYVLDSSYIAAGTPPFAFSNLTVVDNHTAWAKFTKTTLSLYNDAAPLVPEKPDLEITLTADKDQLQPYTYQKFTLHIINRGISKATGIKVSWLPPYNRTPGAGGPFAFTAAYSSKGSYDYWRGVWSLDSLMPNDSATATMHLYVLRNDKNVVQTAQVIAENEVDLDSSPNNLSGAPKEDDETSFTSKGAAAAFEPVNNFAKSSEPQSAVSPNPAGASVSVSYDFKGITDATITITDMNGRVLKTFQLAGVEKGAAQIPTGDLTAGTYIISVTGAYDRTPILTQRLSVVH